MLAFNTFNTFVTLLKTHNTLTPHPITTTILQSASPPQTTLYIHPPHKSHIPHHSYTMHTTPILNLVKTFAPTAYKSHRPHHNTHP